MLLGFTLPAPLSATCTDLGRVAFYGGGTGEAASPYLISTVAHLQALRDRVNGGVNQAGCHFRQTTHLDLSGIASWVAIGSVAEFHGNYDGGSHRVHRLRISQPDPAVSYYGLFGYVRNGSIQNVRLTDVDIALTFEGVTEDRYVGALAARINSSTGGTTVVSASSVSGDLNLTYRGTRDFYAGGLVGRGGTGALLDDRLAFVGRITAVLKSTSTSATSKREMNIGGILGRSSNDTQLSLGYSSAEMVVTVEEKTAPAGSRPVAVGILAGSSSSRTSQLSELYAVGSITVLRNDNAASNELYTGAIGFIENEFDTFTDIYYVDTLLGGFSSGAVAGFDPNVGYSNVAARTDAQMRGAAPAGTMTGTGGRWNYRNAPGAGDPDGKWFLVLAPGAGEYPYPVFAWEASASPPVDLVATPGNGEVSVAFTAGPDGGNPITDYQYQLDNGAWVSAGTAVSPVIIQGLTNGTDYTIRLRAVTAAGFGAVSLPVVATPAALLSAPTGLAYLDATPSGVYGTAASTTQPTLVSDGGEAVTYGITNPGPGDLPAPLSIDPATGVIGWGPDLNAGIYVLTVEARNTVGAATSTVTLTITPLPVTVSPAADQSKAFGTEDPAFTFTTNPVLAGGLLSGVLARQQGEVAGVYAFTLGTLDAGPNYTLALAGDAPTFTIRAAAPRGLSYANVAASGIYGIAGMSGAPTLLASGGAPVRYSIREPLNLPAGLSIDSSTGMLVWTEILAAGSYTLQVAAANSAGSTEATVTLVIAPRVLSVVPDAGQSKPFGSADPEFVFTIVPAVEGVPFVGALSRQSGETVGEYAFTLGTLSAGSNYVLQLADAPEPFFIQPTGPSGLGYDPEAVEGTYGSGGRIAAPALLSDGGESVIFRILQPASPPTGVAIDPATGEIAWPVDLDAGTYAFEIAAQNRVGAATARVSLTVRPLGIQVLPDAGQSKAFGSQDPIFTYALDPVLSAEAVTGELARELGEAVGTYAFQLGTLTAGRNYALSIRAEAPRFTVVPASPQGLVYGDAALTGIYGTAGNSAAPSLQSDGGEAVRYTVTAPEILPEGLVIDPLTGVIRWSATLNAGDYRLTIAATNSGGSAAATVEIQIAPLPVTVQPDAGQLKVIGSVDPVFTYTLSPTLDPSIVTGALSREAGEGAGFYAFTLGDLSAGSNYALILGEDAPKFMIARPEISVTTTLSTEQPALGDTVTVRILVQSTGAVPAENIRIRITPDQPRLEVLAWRASAGTVDEANWTWLIAKLEPGEQRVLEFDAVVREGVDVQPGTVVLGSTGTDTGTTKGGVR